MLFGSSARTRTVAEAAVREGDTKKAITLYEKVLKKHPDDLKARKILGDLLFSEGRVDEAVSCFEALAHAYAEQGLLFRAISACRKILEIAPTHSATQDMLAGLYAKQGGGPKAGSTTLCDDDSEVDGAAIEVVADDFADEDVEITDSGLDIVGEENAVDDDDESGTVDLDLDVEDLVIGASSIDPERLRHASFSADNPPPLFADLSPEAFGSLIERLSLWEIPEGTQVLTQGDSGDSFFIIAAGQVRVERDLPSGERIEVATLGEGDFFGEIAILARHPRTAHVVTTTYTELLEVTREVIDELIAEHPRVEAVLNQFANERLVRNLLKTSALFSALDDDTAMAAIAAFTPHTASMGETLITQGGPPTGLHVIAHGEVEVSSDAGGYQHLAQLREGDVFGEMSLFFDEPASATCTTVLDTTVLTLSVSDFKRFISENRSVEEKLKALCAERVEADAKLQDHRSGALT